MAQRIKQESAVEAKDEVESYKHNEAKKEYPDGGIAECLQGRRQRP